jgi:hypothetical protein
MGKFKISAGAEIDVLTKDELASTLDMLTRSWMAETTRGKRFRRFMGSAPVVAGAVSLVDNVDNITGPGAAMMWQVKSLAVVGLAASDAVDVYINGSDAVASLVRPAVGGGLITRVAFSDTELVLGPNDTLTLSGSALTSLGPITLFGRCAEIPRELAYKLQ